MLDQLGNGLLLGIIISVASVALSLLYGVTRIVNFAHGEIIALGAIMTLFFSSPCLLYTSPSPRDVEESRMPSSA